MKREDILRYLKSKGMKNPQIEGLIDEVIDEVKKIATPKYIYGFYEIEKTENIHILNTKVYIESSNLMNHLKDCDSIAIMAATLGMEVDRVIRINEKIDLTKSVITDAVATAYIEEICDEVQEKIRIESGVKITSRFSPGYGDLKIETQKDILPLINAHMIGLTLTKSMMMIPRKSVTAFIGLCESDIKTKSKCETCCERETCVY
ncbi:MAG: methionine synthase, partial [Oscillospiraceae bacterium]|nr:methionine synthase [Oscillospiraceae bacterium]